MNPLRSISLALALVPFLASADGPSDNAVDKVRRVPPPGVKISDTDRTELTDGAAKLAKEIETLRSELKSKPALLELLPDVEVYHKAVDWALRYDEFFKTNETGNNKSVWLHRSVDARNVATHYQARGRKPRRGAIAH